MIVILSLINLKTVLKEEPEIYRTRGINDTNGAHHNSRGQHRSMCNYISWVQDVRETWVCGVCGCNIIGHRFPSEGKIPSQKRNPCTFLVKKSQKTWCRYLTRLLPECLPRGKHGKLGYTVQLFWPMNARGNI